MSESQTVNELVSKLNGRSRQSVEAHLKDELRTGIVELPPIQSGVAKLDRLEFYNKDGVLKFRAIGAVVAPVQIDGVPTTGMETAQFATFTEKGMDIACSQVLEVVRKMVGQQTLDRLTAANGSDLGGLVKTCSQVTAACGTKPIYFRFSNKFEENRTGRIDARTNQPYPGEYRQRWQPAIVGYTPPGAPALATNGNGTHVPKSDAKTPDPAPWSERKAPPAKPAPTPAPKPEPETFSLPGSGGDTGADADDLVQRAIDNDRAAQDELANRVKSLGYTDDDIDGAPGWEEIGGWLTTGVKKGGDGGGVEQTFSVGTVVRYLPPDAKYPGDKTKRNKRAIDCEVVNSFDGQLTLRSVTHPDRVWLEQEGTKYVTLPD